MGSIAGKSFRPGIHVPSLTWFRDTVNQEIDWDVQRKHLSFLIESGLHGIVLAGTNGEAVTLSPSEKAQLVKTTRELAIQLGRPELTVTLGCGGASTHQVIAETKVAAASGADFVLVLVPSYFHFAMNEDAIIAFFEELANESPIPVLIYNFPGVSSGLDCNSDILEQLGKHPNIVGVKLTCGGIAKVARVRSRFEPEYFCALAGQGDWLLPAISVGGTGSVTGLANVYPRACIELFNLAVSGSKAAEQAQIELSAVEWALAKGGINGTKWAVAKYLGYPEPSSHTRRPYPRYSDAKKQTWILETLRPLEAKERKLKAAGT